MCETEAVGRWWLRLVERRIELGGAGAGSQLASWSRRNRPTMRRRAALRPKSPLNLCHTASSSASLSW